MITLTGFQCTLKKVSQVLRVNKKSSWIPAQNKMLLFSCALLVTTDEIKLLIVVKLPYLMHSKTCQDMFVSVCAFLCVCKCVCVCVCVNLESNLCFTTFRAVQQLLNSFFSLKKYNTEKRFLS